MAEIAPASPADLPAPLPLVDQRTRLPRVARQIQREVTQALGGTDNISPQQAIGAHQLGQVSAMRQSWFARFARGEEVRVEEFTALAAAEARMLKLLGFNRRAKRVEGLHEYMQRKTAGAEA